MAWLINKPISLGKVCNLLRYAANTEIVIEKKLRVMKLQKPICFRKEQIKPLCKSVQLENF